MKGLSLEEFNQDYGNKCANVCIIPKYVISVNLNKKNILVKIQPKEKDYNSILIIFKWDKELAKITNLALTPQP